MGSEVDKGKQVGIEQRLDQIEEKLDGVSKGLAFQGLGSGFNSSGRSDEIDLRELWDVIWAGKWVIITTTFVFAVLSVAYALYLPNIYKSEALLAPAEENSGGGISGLAGQFGGLASLAGVNLGGGGTDKTALALEVLQSREFVSNFIKKHDLLVPLMAAEGWERNEDALIINPDLYDVEGGRWIRPAKPPRASEPSTQEAYKVFIEQLIVVQDKTTNFVTIGFEHFSPILAKAWVDMLVSEINHEIKAREVAEAEKSIRYLTGQLDKTPVADMKAVFYELIEEQSKTVMFAEVRDEYVFKTIDEAVVPELKSKPKRAIVVIFGVILGGVFSFSFVLLCFFVKSKRC